MKKILLFFVCIFLSEIVIAQIQIETKWIKYFTPVEDKIVGVWPHNSRYDNVSRLKELRHRWGFNHILLARTRGMNDYNMLREAGYDSLNIIKQIRLDSYEESIESVPSMWAYYIDEPAEVGDPLTSWVGITNLIKSQHANAKIVIGGYKRNDEFQNYVNTIADYSMFSSYKHWWEVLGTGWWISVPENPDQRRDWADMKSLFGNKFQFSWVGAHKDLSEYYDLLGKAKNMGLEGVYLFQHRPHDNEVDDENLESFATAASYNGFLTTHYQQVRYYYENDIIVDQRFVGDSYPSLPDEYDHSTFTLSNYIVTNNLNDNYFAQTQLTAGGTGSFLIPTGKQSVLSSNLEVRLQPGFHAENGSDFKAIIEID